MTEKMSYMEKRVLLIATVQSHIGQFHKPLMQLLKEHGWEIHVAARDNLTEKNGLQLEYPDRVFNIDFQRSPFDRRNIKAYRQLKHVLAENQYNVIHCNTPVGGILGRLAGSKYRKTGTQVFYTAHGFHFYKGAPKQNWLIYYPIEKWMARYTDKLITITEEDYQLAKTKFKCPVYHTHGVGANSTKYHPLNREEQAKLKTELGLSNHIIVNCGELLPNKNQKTAILAMKQLAALIPDIQLLIAGNGPERPNLEKCIEDLELKEYVKFLGYTLQLDKYLQVCDLELACSYREGLPLNIMEAMLCGKPVVASMNRGHRELVIDGTTGFLVLPDDVNAYVKAVNSIIRDSVISERVIFERAKMYADYTVTEELRQIYEL